MERNFNFEAPIPGQSLTGEPKAYPWESPPQFDNISDVIDFYMERFSEQEIMDDLFIALEEGLPLNILVKSILSTGVMEGVHTIDVSLLIAPVLHEYILGAARSEGIKVRERPMTKDEKISRKEKEVLAATIKRSLERSPAEDAGKEMLEEAWRFVEADTGMKEPEPEEAPMEEPMPEQAQGLMSRRGT